MKKIFFSVFSLVFVLGFQSCSEDFEVAAPYKDVTVVYGLLNMQDTAHYIRIQKAFLDEDKNAFDMAKEPDSNFYRESELLVVMKEISNGTAVGAPIPLSRVDMNLEGYPKKDGNFFTSPNYGYKFKKALNPAYKYRLVITHTSTGNSDSSEINVLDSSRLSVPRFSPNLNFKFNFSKTVPQDVAVFRLDVQTGFPRQPGDARYVEGVVRFNWVEKNIVTGAQSAKHADMPFGSTDILSRAYIQSANVSFYSFLNEVMKPAPAEVHRFMDSCDFFIYGAEEHYFTYLQTLGIQSSGLSSESIQPVYSNIEGKNVFGLFSSRLMKIKENVAIDETTMDSLMNGSKAKNLNIKGRVPL